MRKQLEGELKTFFNVIPAPLCIVDLEGNFKKVNKAWQDILGYSADELVNSNFMEFIHPQDRQEISEIFANEFRRGNKTLKCRKTATNKFNYG